MRRLLGLLLVVTMSCSPASISGDAKRASTSPAASGGSNPLRVERSQTTSGPSTPKPKATAVTSDGSGSPSPASNSPAAGESPASTPDNCTDKRGSDDVTIVMKDTFFRPKCTVVKPDQLVKLSNTGSLQHNFTITGVADFNVDASKKHDLEASLKVGDYPFFCKFHRGSKMSGTLVVRR